MADEAALRAQLTAVTELLQAYQAKGSVVAGCVDVLTDLIDGVILDVALESHRTAHHSPDAHARDDSFDSPMPSAAELETWGVKNQRDVWGQSHPQVATDSVHCSNCKRAVQAGRYAPHLEKCLGKGRNASRSAKRPTSYLEPSLKEGSRSPKKSKHKQPTYDEDAYLGYSAEGVDEDGFNVDPFGPDGTGLGSAKDINITSANGGKWRRKVRSLLAERVRLSDLQGYIAMPPSDDNPAAMSIAAQVISHASDVFCKLQRGMDKVRTKLEDVQGVLSNVCCVVSQRESTLGKICANSVNCPIHAMDQRHEVRRILFGADALPPVVPVKKKKKKKAPVVVVPTVSVAAAASNNPAAAAAAAPLGVVGGAAPRVLLAAAAPPPQVLVHPQHRPPQHHQHHPHAAVGVHLDLDDMAMLPGENLGDGDAFLNTGMRLY